jgi:uncharacterized membrane protein (DUF106 family)
MIYRFLEFFVVGLILGVAEDLLAIFLVTGEPIDLRVFIIAFIVAFPFAVFSELIVDHEKFKNLMKKWFRKN